MLDLNVEQANDMIDNLAFDPPTTAGEETALLAALPPADPDAPMTVVTSLRLSTELKHRIDAAAQADVVSSSTWIRRAIESALAGRDPRSLVSIDDVIRAVRAVPPAA
ncbi:MAG: hypothetical protein KJO75_15055 [Dactylosporangium sp.]|nr:hypothetical protein [Dactylosporangium sp.]